MAVTDRLRGMATRLYEGATEPIWFGDRKVYSVTGFVMGVRTRIVDLPGFWVHGEISDFKYQKHLSMVYFTLKDPENGYCIRCTLGRTRFEQIGIQLQDGDTVHVFGRPDIYAPQGSFQLRAQTIEHTGRGLLMQQLEALKEKLFHEGLFEQERKLPLPFLPRRVGVITGADAAAQGDFVRNITERYPPVKLVMCETLVQGERAAPLLVAALRNLDAIEDVDVIVITRGGGAFEHFLPFCDERLCRTIAACTTPVVSAIGHEKDNPISDYVADLRVSTPTAAARTVVPEYARVVDNLYSLQGAGRRRIVERIERRTTTVASLRGRLTARAPHRFVTERKAYIAQCRQRALTLVSARIERQRATLAHHRKGLEAVGRSVETKRRRVGALGEQLRALSPQQVVARGYALVRTLNGTIIRTPQEITDGTRVALTLSGGSLSATLNEVERSEHDK